MQHQTYWYYHSSGSNLLDQEGDSVIWATQSLHRYAQPSALERTLQLCFGIGPTWGMTVTSYKPKLNWLLAGCQESFLIVGEVIQPHWTATAHLKLNKSSGNKVLSHHWPPAPLGAWGSGHLSQVYSNCCTKQLQEKYKETSTEVWVLECLPMMTGLSTDLQTISDVWKTAIINSELLHLQIDIAVLQETPLAEFSCLRYSDYTFFWQGKKKEDYANLV